MWCAQKANDEKLAAFTSIATGYEPTTALRHYLCKERRGTIKGGDVRPKFVFASYIVSLIIRHSLTCILHVTCCITNNTSIYRFDLEV